MGKQKNKYKKGDVVKVWSLQSFFHGGFLNGKGAIVSQDQIGESVMIAVKRNIGGKDKIDRSYEVYPEQLKRATAVEARDIIKEFKTENYDLKPCPFCGSVDIRISLKKTAIIECRKCGCMFIKTDVMEAKKMWNNRGRCL